MRRYSKGLFKNIIICIHKRLLEMNCFNKILNEKGITGNFEIYFVEMTPN